MPTVDTDIIVTIFRSGREQRVGQNSVWTSKPHPGTGKKIEGWRWDERYWPDRKELQAAGVAPSIWDPTSHTVLSDYQSGHGGNEDTKLTRVKNLLQDGKDLWAPILNHGYFYDQNREFYLFSDSHQTQYLNLTPLSSGKQYVDLTHDFKPTNPVHLRQYRFDRITGDYDVAVDCRKLLVLSGGTDPEFILDTSSSPTRAITNLLNTSDSSSVTLTGDTAAAGEMAQLEFVGVGTGEEDLRLNLEYSPVDSTQTIQVFSYADPISPIRQYTVISPSTAFSAEGSLEVQVDTDTGTIVFGNWNSSTGTGAGHIPGQAHKISVHYTKGLEIKYEPVNSTDSICATTADINPISSIDKGFVQISAQSQDPASLILSAELPQINPYLIEIGNNIGTVVGTVRNRSGELLEGVPVTFEIKAPSLGNFGTGSTTITATTDADGEAKATYRPPLTADDLGVVTTDVAWVGGTTITISGVEMPDAMEDIYLYRIADSDETLGVLDTDIPALYAQYFIDEGITQTPSGSSDPADMIAYEVAYRQAHDLPELFPYSSEDLLTGKKTIVLTNKPSGVMHPHLGRNQDYSEGIQGFLTHFVSTTALTATDGKFTEQFVPGDQVLINAQTRTIDTITDDNNLDVTVTWSSTGVSGTGKKVFPELFSPLYPTSITDIGVSGSPVLELVYSGVSLDLPGTAETKAYFLVAQNQTKIGATAPNVRSGETVHATDIGMRIQLSAKANGTLFCTALNGVTAGTLKRVVNVEDVALTGIISAIAASTNVVGSGTVFTEELVEGEIIVLDGEQERTIDTITDDTNLVITSAVTTSLDDRPRRRDLLSSTVTALNVEGSQIAKEYLDDRDFNPFSFKKRVSDPNTVCLHHFDTSLITGKADDSGNGFNLGTAVAVIGDSNEGFITSGESSTAADIGVRVTGPTGLWETDSSHNPASVFAPNTEGTIETTIKLTNPLLLSDPYSYALLDFVWANSTVLASIALTVDSGIRKIQGWLTSGSSVFVEADEEDLLNGKWHTLKLTWKTTGVASGGLAPYEIKLYLDDVLLGGNSGEISELGASSSSVFRPIATEAPLGTYFDEVRLSDIVRSEKSGPYQIETFEEWFRRTKRGDTATLSLIDVLDQDCPAEIPLGFRLKSSGITVSSVLDRVTYIDPNRTLKTNYYSGD